MRDLPRLRNTRLMVVRDRGEYPGLAIPDHGLDTAGGKRWKDRNMGPSEELAALRNRVAALEVLIVAMAAHITLAGDRDPVLGDPDWSTEALLVTLIGDRGSSREALPLAKRLAAALIDEAQTIVESMP